MKLTKTYDVCKGGEPKLTVVLVHGIAADSDSFTGLLEYFEHIKSMYNIRFVAFDLLGAGKSYTSDELNYDFKDQLAALENSIKELNSNTPVVIIAHSMGTLISARLACLRKNLVDGLILVSPPIYRKEDIENPMFTKAMDGFREVVARKDNRIVKTKQFNNEIKYIVSDPENYDYLVKLNIPTTIVYGELDKIIAPFNIPQLLKDNTTIRTIKTVGSHGVTPDKFMKISKTLEGYLKKLEKADEAI